MSSKNFFTLLDQYKQVAFPDAKESSSAFELFDTVDHVKSIPDQVRQHILILSFLFFLKQKTRFVASH